MISDRTRNLIEGIAVDYSIQYFLMYMNKRKPLKRLDCFDDLRKRVYEIVDANIQRHLPKTVWERSKKEVLNSAHTFVDYRMHLFLRDLCVTEEEYLNISIERKI